MTDSDSLLFPEISVSRYCVLIVVTDDDVKVRFVPIVVHNQHLLISFKNKTLTRTHAHAHSPAHPHLATPTRTYKCSNLSIYLNSRPMVLYHQGTKYR